MSGYKTLWFIYTRENSLMWVWVGVCGDGDNNGECFLGLRLEKCFGWGRREKIKANWGGVGFTLVL
jgi:hypothetical protein